jgi:hypothetical protein
VAKEFNTPTVPQLRPIENFWAIVKKKYTLISCQNTEKFKHQDKKKIQTKKTNGIQRIMRKVAIKVKKATKFGVDFFSK